MTHTLGASAHVATPDGRQLHYMVRGDGPVTVVFESGLGLSRSSWGLVVPAIAERAWTVVYDRAGTGRSDPDPRPRTLERLTEDLLTLLHRVGDGPFVLVGHSWGGAIVRSAAAVLPPRQVCGVVLVDQVDERCDLYFSPAGRRRFAMTARTLPTLARLGVFRATGSRPGRVQPADVYADHRREDFGPSAAAAMVAELATFLDDLAALRERPPVLDHVPVTVITGTKPTRADKPVRQAIVAAHRETAAAFPHGRLVEAAGSAHLVMFDEPEVVVRAIEAHLP